MACCERNENPGYEQARLTVNSVLVVAFGLRLAFHWSHPWPSRVTFSGNLRPLPHYFLHGGGYAQRPALPQFLQREKPKVAIAGALASAGTDARDALQLVGKLGLFRGKLSEVGMRERQVQALLAQNAMLSYHAIQSTPHPCPESRLRYEARQLSFRSLSAS